MTPGRWPVADASLARLAVIESLDRWLPFPLDQALVDAERGVARARVARVLHEESARRAVRGDALQLARQASGGVVRYLSTARTRRRTVPPGLAAALRKLVEGYDELLSEVDGRADRELAAVGEAWRALAMRRPANSGPLVGLRAPALFRPRRPRVSLLDPRQVRARVLAQSADPLAGEIVLDDARVLGGPAIRVRVPAYRCALDQPVVQRLLVRILDTTSAEPRGYAPLAVTRRGRRTVYFEGIVPLRGKGVGRLRADVFDQISSVPPIADDADPTLCEARRATVLLGEWRRLLAAARLPVAGMEPAHQLRELARVLAPDNDRERPLFSGGPSAADLYSIADAGDQEILRRARGKAGADRGLFDMARGVGRPLVAELAAVRTTRTG
jgi:hypothetical protein